MSYQFTNTIQFTIGECFEALYNTKIEMHLGINYSIDDPIIKKNVVEISNGKVFGQTNATINASIYIPTINRYSTTIHTTNLPI